MTLNSNQDCFDVINTFLCKLSYIIKRLIFLNICLNELHACIMWYAYVYIWLCSQCVEYDWSNVVLFITFITKSFKQNDQISVLLSDYILTQIYGFI